MRLNQAASNALMARLEAQKAICDSSERELHKKFKQKDELEAMIRPEWENARKRLRMNDTLPEAKDNKTLLYLPGNRPSTRLMKMNNTSLEEKNDKSVLCLPGINPETPSHKELREFLEEEHKLSEEGLSMKDEEEAEQHEIEEGGKENVNPIEKKLQKLKIEEDGNRDSIQFAELHESEGEEDEESRKQRGKGNVDKWLQMLLESNDQQNLQTADENTSKTDEIIRKLNLKYPKKEIKILRFPDAEGLNQTHEEEDVADMEARKIHLNNQLTVTDRDGGGKREEEIVEEEARRTSILQNPPYKLVSRKSSVSLGDSMIGSSTSFERREKVGKEKGLMRCESSRGFRRIPSSPSIILGMRKGVDCIGKKPLVIGDDEVDEDRAASNNFIRSSIKSIKKAVKI